MTSVVRSADIGQEAVAVVPVNAPQAAATTFRLVAER
jgi:hypothetical protein